MLTEVHVGASFSQRLDLEFRGAVLEFKYHCREGGADQENKLLQISRALFYNIYVRSGVRRPGDIDGHATR